MVIAAVLNAAEWGAVAGNQRAEGRSTMAGRSRFPRCWGIGPAVRNRRNSSVGDAVALVGLLLQRVAGPVRLGPRLEAGKARPVEGLRAGRHTLGERFGIAEG